MLRARYSTWFHLFLIAGSALIAYFPALALGFWTDDYLHLDLVARAEGWDFLTRIFDPRQQMFWYRPLVGLQWKIAYTFLRGELSGYHFIQVAYHALNAILLYALTRRITSKSRVGVIAGLLYATFALPSMTVYWPAVHDPLAGIFALSAMWWWLDYLETARREKFLFAHLAFIGAILAKEITAVLPALLFIADRVLITKPISIFALMKRYAGFLLIVLMYAPLYLIVATQSVFTQTIGYGVSDQIANVFAQFLALLVVPVEIDDIARRIALVSALAILIALAFTRDRRWWLLLAAAILPTLILSPIPAHLTNPRYLYLPLLATAAGYAIAGDALLGAVATSRWARALVWLALAGFIFFNSATIGERIENRAGFTRQLRQQFRAIYQAHPTFAPGTYLYFLEMPLQTLDISGLMFLRYGANVTVNGIDQPRDAALQNHSAAFVYYYDEPGRFKEQAVESNAAVNVALPIQFEHALALEKIEIVNTTARRGEAFIAILHWRAAQRLPQDYTLFAHLTNAAGALIAGADSQPQRGRAPTTTWRAQQRVRDYVIIPLDADVPPGEYRVQIGWYDNQTQQRLARTDAFGDALDLGLFRVLE